MADLPGRTAGWLAWVAVAIYLHFPKVLVLILTSLAGAELLLGGVFLALGRITLTGLRFGAVGAIVRDSWFWGLLYLAIAAIGFYFQWRTTQTFVVEEYSAENPFTTAGTSAATGVDGRRRNSGSGRQRSSSSARRDAALYRHSGCRRRGVSA